MIALQLLLPHLRSPLLLLQQILLGTIAFGVQLVAAPLTLRMLDLYPRARGSAASVQSCVSIAIAAIVFGFLSPVLSGSMLTLACGSFCAALAAFILWQLAQRALRRTTLTHAR